MRITKLGHSCLHVIDGGADILIDPGSFSAGFEDLTGLTAVLVTHQHPDHLDLDRLPSVLEANPGAAVYADAGSATMMEKAGIAVTTVSPGDSFDVGVGVTVHGGAHAVIHADIPVVSNAAYLLNGRLLHPGDSFTELDTPVEILALPAAAPWMALKEAVDYFRRVGPQVAFPIHERVLANSGTTFAALQALGPQDSQWLTPADGEPFDL
jgi:L-ascorbate metabolism protein UlaG (beta-lactamase superfamily)